MRACTSARIESAISSGVSAPMSTPAGPWILRAVPQLDPGRGDLAQQVLGSLTRAEQADVRGVGPREMLEDPAVVDEVVGQDDTRGPRVDRWQAGFDSIEVEQHDPVRFREAVRSCKRRPRVGDGDVPAEGSRHPDEGHRIGSRAEHQQTPRAAR